MYWTKIFKTKQDLVVAICDQNLLGKEINLEKTKVKISKEFYGGKLISEHVAIRLLEQATIANLFGKEIIDIAERNGFIIKENSILIDGIPHAQFVKIKY